MESGDESVAVAPTPKGSVNTGTDAGTDYGEDEEVEVTASPGMFIFSLTSFVFCRRVLSFFFFSFPLSAAFGEDSERRPWEGREGPRSARARERHGLDSSKEAETRVEGRTFDGRTRLASQLRDASAEPSAFNNNCKYSPEYIAGL